MRILRVGVTGDDVLVLETFLRGRDLLTARAVDKVFDAETSAAVKRFQAAEHLSQDGEFGPKTMGRALGLGYPVLSDPAPSTDRSSLNWPPRPGFSPLSYDKREQLLGKILHKSSPVPGNPEAITITNSWAIDHVVTIDLPQLKAVPGIVYQGSSYGKPKTTKLQVHRLIADSIRALWQAWEDEKLLDRILTFDGLWVPRYVRGMIGVLSNHSFASAWDCNAFANPLGAVPARLGQRGCVRELVPLANKHGYYWLGHSDRRKDGMHLEAAVPALGGQA